MSVLQQLLTIATITESVQQELGRHTPDVRSFLVVVNEHSTILTVQSDNWKVPHKRTRLNWTWCLELGDEILLFYYSFALGIL